MIDASNLLLDSDYPVDKLVLIKPGSFSASTGSTSIVLFAHELPFTPLPLLLWSNTPDFSNSNILVDENMYRGNNPTGQSYSISSDSTNINISAVNLTGSVKTVYYKVIAFAPSDAPDVSIPATNTLGNKWLVNSDYNYMKLFWTGRFTYGGANSFTHNLGYVPMFFGWSAISGKYTPNVYNQIVVGSSGTAGYFMTSTELTAVAMIDDAYEYRIYLDA